MTAYILSLATALPPFVYSQADVAERMGLFLGLDSTRSEKLKKIYDATAIKTRYSVLDDFAVSKKEFTYLGSRLSEANPSMSVRNERYKREAPKLAQQAAEKALSQYLGDRSDISHIISVSCTGCMAPGLEIYLIDSLGLRRDICRLGINFMGCFGAFKGLSAAQAYVAQNPHHRVLVVCTELCSLHLQPNWETEIVIANALFADGAAAVIVGGDVKGQQKPLWQIDQFKSLFIGETSDKMTWEASEKGFLMRLSQRIPAYIGEQIGSFVKNLLGEEIPFSDCDWAIHPGGKAILETIERCTRISKEQTAASWKVLSNYGNMSSATFLFVLEALLHQKSLHPWTIGLGFGPGLSLEGVLLQSVR